MFGILTTLLLFCGILAGAQHTECHRIGIPSLKANSAAFRVARTCWPSQPGLYPLHVFAHGDFGGAADSVSYWGLQEQVAGLGFVVAMYESCWQDQQCANGQESFREVVKTLQHFEEHKDLAPINFGFPYSVSGHSTGGRVALMLASIRDNPAYLRATPFNVSDNERATINRIQAVVADHPDLMSDTRLNPDLPNYRISATPVLVVTGTRDHIEPNLSAWQDFVGVRHPNKIFVNVANTSHFAPIQAHAEAPFIAYFSMYFAVGDVQYEKLLYTNISGALFNDTNLSIAQPGDYNTGDNKVGAVACQLKSGTVEAFPMALLQYCTSLAGER